MFDVQLFTTITIDSATETNVPVGSFIEGLSSGASGFLVTDLGTSGNTTLKLDQVSGTFIKNEPLRINGRNELPNGTKRSVRTVTKFGLEDILSVHQNDSQGSGIHFSGDLVLQQKLIPNLGLGDEVSINGSNILTCAGKTFGSLKVDDIIIVNDGASDPKFNRITAISNDLKSVTLAATDAVTGVNAGAVLQSTTRTGVHVARPQIFQNDVGLYAPLSKKNVSDVGLGESKLFIKEQVNVTSSAAGVIEVNISDFSGISNATFAPFDADRYSISQRTTGNTTHTILDSSQVSLSNNNTTITFTDIDFNSTACVVTVTLEKDLIDNKTKNVSRSNSISIQLSSQIVNSGITTNGLTSSRHYGLRVQDKEISLQTPDVYNIAGIFESVNLVAPVLDKLVFVSGLSLDTATILGEKIKGAESGAVAVLAAQDSATTVEIVLLTQDKFEIGESVTFVESNITTNLQGIQDGLYKDITSNFKLDDGQRDEFADYSRIVRKDGANVPSRIVRVIYDKFTVPSNDTGDVFTVNSYPIDRFKDVPILKNGLRASDTLDFRPRVADHTGGACPFTFAQRVFSTSGSNPTLVPAPNEASTLDFQFYLPRIDKIVLNSTNTYEDAYTNGDFQVIKGTSSEDPVVPSDIETAMTVGTIELPAYLYDTSDVKVTLVDNRRYTMRDIGTLEDRIESLEELTSLSLLELDTKTLQVQDADGLSRFKSGFFVDDFKNTNLLDNRNPDCKCDVISSLQQLVTPTDFYSLKPELALASNINPNTADFSQDLELLDSGVRKTGDLITLDYDEVTLLNQPLASRVENVNPFNMVSFVGNMVLSPSADTWTRNIILDDGTRTVLGDTEETFTNDRIVSSEPDTHIRSRNVSFDVNGIKPTTRFYPFFDGTKGIDIIPKLIEISMDSGSFDVNETVEGFVGGDRVFAARTCAPNHKNGSISSPTTTYSTNPYNKNLTIPSLYSSSSTILNIDIASLVEEAQGRFFGRIKKKMKLVGSTSGATATVSRIRLISDTLGDLKGSFFFRDPLSKPTPKLRFTNGVKSFKLTTKKDNSAPLLGDAAMSEVETTYRTSGFVDTFRQSTVVVRIPPPPPQPLVFNITNEFITNEITNVTNVTEITNVTNVTNNITNVTNVTEDATPARRTGGGRRRRDRRRRARRSDPLAQSFTVDGTGCFLTAVDLYFRKKDVKEKLMVQIRTMELGIPTLVIVQDFAQVVLEPSQVNVSEDASVPTRVTFPSPIYLPSGEEYCVVLLAPTTNNYEAWVGRMGEPTIETQSLPDAESVVISKQYIGGSLFKSQNGSIWTPSQFEDLKVTFYKADFAKSTDAEVTFYNPQLNYESAQIPNLRNNAIHTLPRKLKVPITATQNSTSLDQIAVGARVGAGAAGVGLANTTPNGIVESIGGVVATVATVNDGQGYVSGTPTVNNIDTFNIVGNGSGLTVNVAFANNAVNTVAINAAGSGYVKGDIVGIVTSFTGVGKGANAQFEITGIGNRDTLYLTNVQGEKFDQNDTLLYFNSSTDQFAAVSNSILVTANSNVFDDLYSGNVIEVEQYNHGMHAGNNKLTISNVQPDTAPVVLNSAVGLSTATLVLTDPQTGVAATTTFNEFEGIPASTGLVKVNNEIMRYNGINANSSLTITERGVDGTRVREHEVGSLVFKYEFNGFSLSGINTDHQLPSTSALVNASDIDKYYLEINRSTDRKSGDDMMNFFDDSFGGGKEIFASQNIQFNQIYPIIHVLSPGETAFSARTRTVSGTSAGGNESSFLDQGFQAIQLDAINPLSSPRLVASPLNENEHLSDLPLNRSNTLSIRLLSGDRNLSPIVDTMNSSIVYIRNRLNKPIDNYANDNRVKLNSNDPHAGVYISNRVDLKNPATSLQVIISAQRAESADFRVLYKLFNTEVSEGEQSYELFPGFDNLRDTTGDGFGDEVISVGGNSGRPDAKVPSSTGGEFLEYQFTADNLTEFTGFVIKVVFSGTNEAEAPRFSDLRAIALA